VAITDEIFITNVSCTINITDVNDQTPQFVWPEDGKKYWIDIASDVDKQLKLTDGYPVKLAATDADVNDCFNSVTYSFGIQVNDEYKTFFSLSENGMIFLKDNLTKFPLEVDPDGGQKNLITLEVEVKDCSCADCYPPLVNRMDLKLKVIANVPPEFDSENRTDAKTFDENTKPTFNLKTAFDKNNLEHPDDGSYTTQSIYYYFDNISAGLRDKLTLNKSTNTLTVTGEFDADCDDCDIYEFDIVVSNDKTSAPDQVEEYSRQHITLNVEDINDNSPTFYDMKLFYVISLVEDDDDCKDCTISASDKDTELDKTLTFTILSQNISNNQEVDNPFKLAKYGDSERMVQIQKDNFNPAEFGDEQVYFDLELQVQDNAAHKATTSVKIVVMTDMNNVTFRFDNSEQEINDNEAVILDVFRDNFKWLFSKKSIKQSSSSRNAGTGVLTQLDGYFVDPGTFKPKSQPDIEAEYDKIFDDLYIDLVKRANVTLDGTRGFTGARTYKQYFINPTIIVVSVAGGLVAITAIFLLVAYCLRTTALERRVKALDTDAVEEGTGKKQDKIFLAGLQEAVPGSNEFAESGANPIWQAAMESNDYDEDEFQFGDDVSESSGDSILIGVEDQTEFDDYAAKLKEVDVDMDLYSRVQGKYKTLDDYQVAEDDTADTEVYSVEHVPGRNPMFQSDSDEA